MPKEKTYPPAGGEKPAILEKIEPREVVAEMQESYLDYAMSVIVSRALPDVRDGLKPVHRRILYAMHDLGLKHSAKFRKSATVVGEVLGKYHPHGDVAVYESMVRLAQEFSMRYPLINGQGNFGCFTKDTKIKLADGRDLNFEDLVEERITGKKNYTYTVNSLGLISIAEIKNPRITRKNSEIIRVILNNNEEIKCTPNHLFMLRDGTYREAQSLKSGDSLMPLYQRFSAKTDRINRDGYLLIHQNKTGEWVPIHHLADNYNLTSGIYSKKAGRVRHHLDFNKFNNNPDNIIRLQWSEHWRIHYEQAASQHKNSDYREKIAEGRRKFWANPINRENYAKRISERNLCNWKNPSYREKMRMMLSDVNKEYIKNHPEKRTELSQRASKTLKRLWQDSEYRALFHGKIVAANRRRTANNTGKVKFLKICREVFEGYKMLNRELYERLRIKIYSYGRATLWETGINKYYNGDDALLLQDLTKNHKIKRIEFLKQKEDVYDLTIDKTHNFALTAGIFVHNSIDGDSAAAMRYTEAKLAAISDEMLADIDKDTVDFIDNYDKSRQEPQVMPAKLPNLLLNGTMGIAVGMATNIPPHNLTETIDAIEYLFDHPDATVDDLMNYIKGPDFPGGGIIYDVKAIKSAYQSGKGGIVARAKAEIAEAKKGRWQIVVNELPYQVNKAELLIKIAELVKNKKIEGIRDLRDESDKDGIRMIVELKSDADPQRILNSLFKLTDLQKTFHMNMLALVGGIEPRVLNLKAILLQYIDHQKIVVTRRTKFLLRRAEERLHILEGLSKALKNIDAVIKTIKSAKTKEIAHDDLMKKFKLSSVQSTAILEMKLQTLAGLERKKIEDELAQKQKEIADYKNILAHPKRVIKIISAELAAIKARYGDERRTKIIKGPLGEFSDEDLISDDENVMLMTHRGYIKRMNPDVYHIQKRGGKGVIGAVTKEEDVVENVLRINTRDNLLFFTNRGKVFQTKAFEIPEASRISKGQAIVNFLQLSQDEKVTSTMINKKVPDSAGENFVVMATKEGMIKKVSLSDFDNVRRSGIIAIKIKGSDELKWARITSGKDEIVLVTAHGQSIRFKETKIRAMGRTAGGVRGLRIKKNDLVCAMDVVSQSQISNLKSQKLLIVAENGFGKTTALKEYKVQGRGGSGIKTAKVTSKTGSIVCAAILGEDADKKDLLVISQKGQIVRLGISSIPTLGRATQGVKIMRLNSEDKIASAAIL